MKSNVDRNRETLKEISGRNKRQLDVVSAALEMKSWQLSILMDISVSLASIADSLERGEKND